MNGHAISLPGAVALTPSGYAPPEALRALRKAAAEPFAARTGKTKKGGRRKRRRAEENR